MNENGIQQYVTLEEQLENLKREQAEAERIYRGRMQMGALTHDPASIQQLAQTILDRKLKIDDLEAQIAQTKENSQEQDYGQESTASNEERDTTEQQAMTVYTGRNPVLRWLQKIIDKLEKRIQKLDERSKRDPMDWYKEKFEQEMVHLKDRQYSEYEAMANMDIPKERPKEKTAHQIFVDKISGNGAYHTYGPNAKKLQEPRTMADPEKMKHIQEQKQQTSKGISER